MGKNITIRLIGLTDAPEKSLHGKMVENCTTATCQLEKYYFTITRSQNLESFLSLVQARELNIVLAMNSLVYLSARVYDETIATILTSLKPGGTHIGQLVCDYTGPLPAFRGYFPNELRNPNKSLDIELLNLFIQGYFNGDNISMEMLDLIIKIYTHKTWEATRLKLHTLLNHLQRHSAAPSASDPTLRFVLQLIWGNNPVHLFRSQSRHLSEIIKLIWPDLDKSLISDDFEQAKPACSPIFHLVNQFTHNDRKKTILLELGVFEFIYLGICYYHYFQYKILAQQEQQTGAKRHSISVNKMRPGLSYREYQENTDIHIVQKHGACPDNFALD